MLIAIKHLSEIIFFKTEQNIFMVSSPQVNNCGEIAELPLSPVQQQQSTQYLSNQNLSNLSLESQNGGKSRDDNIVAEVEQQNMAQLQNMTSPRLHEHPSHGQQDLNINSSLQPLSTPRKNDFQSISSGGSSNLMTNLITSEVSEAIQSLLEPPHQYDNVNDEEQDKLNFAGALGSSPHHYSTG